MTLVTTHPYDPPGNNLNAIWSKFLSSLTLADGLINYSPLHARCAPASGRIGARPKLPITTSLKVLEPVSLCTSGGQRAGAWRWVRARGVET